ncbi:MAG TPA: patatin-like phospholipase family protein [Vicinamibacterales bacterium]|jgi:NTE family protein
MSKSLLAVFLSISIVVSASAQDPPRAKVGVAFGGGSARGIAHVGVIKWFEEHHIPIDLVAGTSMGGLIGGSFSTGMDAAELETFLLNLNWDLLFDSSNFAGKNIRRKADGRTYPSKLEFGLKHGIVPPSALNNGEQVDLMVAGIAGPYYNLRSFDDLPTPFRAVAVDLLTATPVVLEKGPLDLAMRATMSLPLIFPPVQLDGHVLVDGGAMNNVPANVVKDMGAAHVIAVNVGDLSDLEKVNYSAVGLVAETLDAMMRANTKAGMKAADIVIDVPLTDYGSLDWRRTPELIAEGYKAAEAMKDKLLPLAVSEEEYARWKAARAGRRRTTLPIPRFVQVEGFGDSDAERLHELLNRLVGVAFDDQVLKHDIGELAGLDRYQSVTWRMVDNDQGESGLLVIARANTTGPPFLMLGLNLENVTSDEFRVSLAARYLAYDVVGSGSELRIDGTAGSNPSVAVELYRPIGSTPLFVAPFAGIQTATLDVIQDNAIVARYGQTLTAVGLNVGVNLGRQSDLRVGAYIGHLDTGVRIGDPGLPVLSGEQTAAQAIWRYDSQDSPVIPSHGSTAFTTLRHIFNEPSATPPPPDGRTSAGLTQLGGEMTKFWTARSLDRVFVLGGIGTSFSGSPLPPDQFALGSPLHLGAYSNGELRGDNYYILTAGYLKRVARLPDFVGGPIFAGAWLENGDAFNLWSQATLRTQLGVGVVMDSLLGPILIGGSAGFDGRWRTYVAIGRLFGPH